MNVGRGIIIKKVGDDEFIGYTVTLDDHVGTTKNLLHIIFNKRLIHDYLTTAVELHDKYKPATMRVETLDNGSYVVGFRGHPYKLGFTDFEFLLSRYGGRDGVGYVGLATAIARLHHFINIRDVETFIHTLAITKAYLSTHGVRVGLDRLRKEVLDGVVMLHIVDVLAGYVEQSLLNHSCGKAEVELIDTSDVRQGVIEPHIPAYVSVNISGSEAMVKAVFHGLLSIINPNIISKPARLELKYDVYSGRFIKSGKDFIPESKYVYSVKMELLHKRFLYGT